MKSLARIISNPAFGYVMYNYGMNCLMIKNNNNKV